MASDNEQSQIEDEFLKSWDGVVASYTFLNASYPKYSESAKLMGSLVADLRRRGYDRRLRAGIQVAWLVLSRSEKHGLRSGQPKLSINLSRNGGLELHYRDVNGQIETVTDKVEFTPELEALLQRLLAHPID